MSMTSRLAAGSDSGQYEQGMTPITVTATSAMTISMRTRSSSATGTDDGPDDLRDAAHDDEQHDPVEGKTRRARLDLIRGSKVMTSIAVTTAADSATSVMTCVMRERRDGVHEDDPRQFLPGTTGAMMMQRVHDDTGPAPG